MVGFDLRVFFSKNAAILEKGYLDIVGNLRIPLSAMYQE